MLRIGEALAVLVDQKATPTLVRWNEQEYLVSSSPVRWFARAES